MIQAGSMGIPYVPIIGLVGSDSLSNRDDMRLAADPFEPGRRTIVARSYRPDVALFHGVKADRRGNVFLGHDSDDVLLAEAARTVIVSVEEIVDLLDEAEMAQALPALLVDVIVEARFGAHPTGCPGRYAADGAHMADYLAAAQDDASFQTYLHETVYGPANHQEYLDRFVSPDSIVFRADGKAPPVRSARSA